MELHGTTALVVGGGSGLGAAAVRELAAAGASVVVADLDPELAAGVATAVGGRAAAVDVTDEESVAEVVALAADHAEAAGRPLRTVVTTAGTIAMRRTVDRSGAPHDLATFERVLRVNLVGTFTVLRHAAARLATAPRDAAGLRGLVVLTASVAAYEGQIGQVAYAASKGGVVGLTLPAARDLAALGVRVVTIAPGVFDTPMLGRLDDEQRAALAADVVLPKRLGDPAEYGRLVVAVAGLDYLNGEVVRLDGALRMPPR